MHMVPVTPKECFAPAPAAARGNPIFYGNDKIRSVSDQIAIDTKHWP
jgi:hypothetical protein